MKFAEKLTAHLTPEWRKQYIDYDELKEFLYKSIQDIDRSEDWTEEVITHLDECDIEFFERCNNALQKIDVFFSEKLAEATRKHANLSEELDDFLQFESTKTTFFAGSKLSVSWRNRESARRSSSEQSDSKSKENGAIRVKLSAVDSDEKQEIEGIVRHRRSRVSTTAENKKPLKPSIKEKKTFRKMHDLKLAFSEFYLSLVLLQNYQTLNFTGFRKILKKHDKLFRRDNGLIWRQQHVEPAKFNTSREVDDLISKVENEYTEKLEQGDRQRAMKRLRVPPLSERHNPRAVFQFGFFAGIFLVQSIVIILACLFLRPLPKHYLPALRIFRTTFLIIFFLCLFGLNTYGWRSSGVNNVLIFEINPRSHMDHFQLLEASFFLATIWGCAVIYFLFSAVLNIPSYASPFVLVLFMLLCLLNPFKFGYYRARRWLLRVLGRIFRAPFCRVTFPDFWLADQLNSLAFILPELARFVCFYSSQISWRDGMNYVPLTNTKNLTAFALSTVPRCALSPDRFLSESCQCTGVLFGLEPILRTLPAWFRFAQCLRRYRDMETKKPTPHVVNAGKYSTTFFVTATSIWLQLAPSVPALVFLTISYLANSTYTYSWDVLMDWGLMECHSDNRLLRDELVYRYKAYYYVAIVEDLILRFTWIIRVAVQQTHSDHYELTLTILYAAEVIRRFIWNFFRLENEHLNNCGEFRAVRDIFITPLPKRPPRTVSTQLFSTVYGTQQKNNLIYPANNSALPHQHHSHHLIHHLNLNHYQQHTPKSKQDLIWTSDAPDKTSIRVDACTSPSNSWDKKANMLTELSRTQRLLNRISAATSFHMPLRALIRPTHYADNHHPHHYHRHIMDNIELTESLRSTLPRSVHEEKIAPHSREGGSCPSMLRTVDPCSDSPGLEISTHTPIQRETGRHDGHAGLSINPNQVGQAKDHVDGQSHVRIQQLRVPSFAHSIPVVRVVRSLSQNDLENCTRTDLYEAPKGMLESSCETISSVDLDVGLLYPTETAITLLSQDGDRIDDNGGSVNAYTALSPSMGQRPRFTTTSYSSLESPVDEPHLLSAAQYNCGSVNYPTTTKAINVSDQSPEIIQGDLTSLRPVYPRVIRIKRNTSTNEGVS